MLGEARFVDIGGRSLYARTSGTGPVVVLNSGGGREGVGSWMSVEERLSELATVVTYDRAGVGQSPSAMEPPTVQDMAEDLEQLLNALGVQPPFVLVGTSLSGLLVQLYACEHPRDIAGLLLLDPTPDEFFAGFRNLPPSVQDSMRLAAVENTRKTGGTDALVWELQKVFESAEQVRHAVVDNQSMRSCGSYRGNARTVVRKIRGRRNSHTRSPTHSAARSPRPAPSGRAQFPSHYHFQRLRSHRDRC